MVAEMPADGNGGNADPQLVSLPIRPLVYSLQTANGLKNEDYHRYRQYCTRRLRRLRRTLQLPCRPNSRAVSKQATTAAAASKFTHPPEPTREEYARDSRYLQLRLLQTERAWAYALDLKSDSDDAGAKTRKHFRARLRKAVEHAAILLKDVERLSQPEQLDDVTKPPCVDRRTVVEAQAYHALLEADFKKEMLHWSEALKRYRKAHQLYTSLVAAYQASEDCYVYEQQAEEILPLIRFCQYNAGDDMDAEPSGQQTPQMLSTSPRDNPLKGQLAEVTVEWVGKTLLVRNQKVREALERAKLVEITLKQEIAAHEETDGKSRPFDDKKVASHYDKMIFAYNDAVPLVLREIEQFSSTGSHEDRRQELNSLLEFLQFGRLQRIVDRNLLLVNALVVKAGDLVKLVRMYDNLVQNVTEILELSGIAGTELESRATLQLTVFKARRCRYLAQCYMQNNEYAKASALFERATKLLGNCSDAESKQMIQTCRALRCQSIALRHTKASTSSKDERITGSLSTTGSATLVSNLDKLTSVDVDTSGFVQLPPSFVAVACKPLLFDIAADGVQLPEKVAQVESPSPPVQAAEPAAGGVFSWLSRR